MSGGQLTAADGTENVRLNDIKVVPKHGKEPAAPDFVTLLYVPHARGGIDEDTLETAMSCRLFNDRSAVSPAAPADERALICSDVVLCQRR